MAALDVGIEVANGCEILFLVAAEIEKLPVFAPDECDGQAPTLFPELLAAHRIGIQLDPDLGDSRRMFDVIFRMLADGESRNGGVVWDRDGRRFA